MGGIRALFLRWYLWYHYHRCGQTALQLQWCSVQSGGYPSSCR